MADGKIESGRADMTQTDSRSTQTESPQTGLDGLVGSENITRAQALRRGQLLQVSDYTIHLDLTTGEEHFLSTSTVHFSCRQPGQDSWIDLIADSVESATLNGQALDPSTYDGFRLPLPNLVEQNTLEVVAKARYMNTGEGLHRFVDPVDNEVYLYTQFEAADARRMYACFEQPDLKARFTFAATAPAHWRIISNTQMGGAPEPVTEDTARWQFRTTEPMSTYITALIAGPYHVVQDSYTGRHGTYPLRLFCRESLAQYLDADGIFEITKQGFAFFEKAFGLGYPFGKYDQLFVPEFNAGAMENAGAVTFREDYIFRSKVTRSAYETRANTILHEMAHMWFGDLVTMRWWDDLWLNESFAEWASHHAQVQATQFTEAWTGFTISRKGWAYRQDQMPSTHPIAADMSDLDAVRVNFDGITYAKGASALKQLVAFVGLEHFIAGLRTYFREFAWGNTELTDLLGHLTRASGRDLDDWAQQWLQTSGVNLLRPILETDDEGALTRVAVVQEPPSSPPGLPAVLRDHRMRIGMYAMIEGSLQRTDSIEVDIAGEVTEIPELIGNPQPDLLLLNDDDLTYAKIRLDAVSAKTAREHLAALDDSLARTLLWAAAWDMTRDAEMTCGDFLDMALAGLPGESQITVVQTVLGQLRVAIDRYAAPEHRSDYRARFARALSEWVHKCEPGSDRQLALLRTWAVVAVDADHLNEIAQILDGDHTLPGLELDTDLRWTLLQGLVRAGHRSSQAVDVEAERDNTAAGARQAAYARACAPTAQAKATAWEAVVDSDELPNAMLDAVMGGFAQAGQEDLLRPYRDRFFAELPQIWRNRTSETAASITAALFPYDLIDDETVAAAQAFLETSPSTACARLIAEGRDAVPFDAAQAIDAKASTCS